MKAKSIKGTTVGQLESALKESIRRFYSNAGDRFSLRGKIKTVLDEGKIN